MTISIKTQIAESTLDIQMDGEMTSSNVPAAKQQCRAILAHAALGLDVRLDMGNITKIDNTGVQLLVALKHELINLGIFIKVVCWSAVVEDRFRFVGIPEFLTEGPAWLE